MIQSDRVLSINLLPFDYILLAAPPTLCNFVVREKRMHKLLDLYSNHGASWELTNLATKTKSSNPFDLKYHCFCLCCDRFALQKTPLSSQLCRFRYYSGVGIPGEILPLEATSPAFSHILLYYTVNTNNKHCPPSLLCFWPLLQSVTTTCVAVEQKILLYCCGKTRQYLG